jgi:MFS family permease
MLVQKGKTDVASIARKAPSQFALSIFWFAWEVHWAALLGAAMQAQVARFVAPGAIGTATAVLSGAGAFFSIASQFAAGRASDKSGRRIPYIAIGTVLDVLALFGFALAPSFSTVVLAFVAVQIAFNVAGGPYQALIPDHVPRERQGWASGIMALYRLAGNAVGLLLAKFLVKQPGPGVSEATLTHGLLLVACALAVLLLVALAVTAAGVPDVDRRPKQTTALPVWPSRSSFVWLVVSRCLVSMGLYLILPFFAFFLRFAMGVHSYLQTSLTLLLTINACSLVGALPAGFLGDRVPKRTIMFGAFALLAAGALVLANVSTTAQLFPLAVMLGIGWGAYYAVDWALACNLLPEGRAGALMALWNIGASGPQVLSPLIGGIVADRIGAASGDLGAGYRLLFEFVGVYVVLGAIALAFVREPRAGKAAQAD